MYALVNRKNGKSRMTWSIPFPRTFVNKWHRYSRNVMTWLRTVWMSLKGE